MKYIPVERPVYLQNLKEIQTWDQSLTAPSRVVWAFELKHREFFSALKEGILPSYQVDGRRYVCPSEIRSILQLINKMQRK